jgi:hypothetical protein
MIELTKELDVIDIHKSTVSGKENVMCLNNEHYFSAPSLAIFDKWISTFKNIKQKFL